MTRWPRTYPAAICVCGNHHTNAFRTLKIWAFAISAGCSAPDRNGAALRAFNMVAIGHHCDIVPSQASRRPTDLTSLCRRDGRAWIRRLRRSILCGESSGWGKRVGGSSRQQSARQMELFKNTHVKQYLARKTRSRLRVICATPFGKGVESGGWERFLYCVCRSPR